ncbi:hypothetical protein DJ535_15510 [Citrobacter murliniae]|uniref:Alpha-galactosidase n=1 Tax=Citrobacter murliniae TaxID=67829 RepID=A0ABY2PTI6_9ENTR|nr:MULTISPECIES: hypothetical protein [Citrobacter freundii complex]KLV66081.1 hypothetical protein SK36_00785 [Citrobacter sp. MGH106]THE36818.1 hypothetical protein DJ535_15510 [Citrobacter murliniae]
MNKQLKWSGLLLAALFPYAQAAQFSQQGNEVTVSHGDYTLRYDLHSGKGDLLWRSTPLIKQFHSEAQLQNPAQTLNSQHATQRTSQWQTVNDKRWGEGHKLVLTSHLAGGRTLTTDFWFFDNRPWLLSDIRVFAPTPLTVSKLTPIAAAFADIGIGSDKRIYTTPYTNNFDFGVAPVNQFGLSQNGTDRFANPQEPMVKFNGISHWVTALLDNQNRHGLVAGAATVQKWKSSQQLGEATRANAPLSHFVLYNWGGEQQGKQVDSDLFFIGYFTDYRDGLETYGKVYNDGEPGMRWQGSVPVGFNAFYSHDSYGKARDMYAMTDYIAQHLKPLGYKYVNMDGGFQPDGYPQGMTTFTNLVHQKGLKAGGYLTPFSIYENWLDLPVDKTGYTHRDACLKDSNGKLIKTYLGSYALDMSHPAAQYIVRRNIKNYVDWGFDYIKLDFLDMGLYEGQHHDPAVNGIQNYRLGMQIMRDEVLNAKRQIFLDASISPLLPAAFTQGRRTACDTSLGVADYSGVERQAFNSALSWWSNGTLYRYNDADMFMPEQLLQGDARSGQRAALRLATAVAMDGGHWLAGDNLPFIDEDRSTWLENKSLLALATSGISARPLSLSNVYHQAEHSPDVLVQRAADNSTYVSFTNWSTQEKTWQLSAAELGLKGNTPWQVTSLYDGLRWLQKTANINYRLAAGNTAILHFTHGELPPVQPPLNLAQGLALKPGENSFTLTFPQPTRINQLVIQEPAPFAMRNYTLSWHDGSRWQPLTRGYLLGDNRTFNFPEINASQFRLSYLDNKGNVQTPTIKAYNAATSLPAMRIVSDNPQSGEKRFDLQGPNQLMQTFSLDHNDLPKIDFWLFENYVNAVPGDNFRIQIVQLDAHNNPEKTLFSAALPPFNLPAQPAIYSLWPRLTGLDTQKRYGFIFSSQDSAASDAVGTNSYGTLTSNKAHYSGGKLRHSSDGGKNWQDSPENTLLFTLYSHENNDKDTQ